MDTKKGSMPAVLLCVLCWSVFMSADDLVYREEVVAGGPEYFMTVRHVILKGSNFAIGRKIGEIAQDAHIVVAPGGTPEYNHTQREYMKNNYPVLYERMKGVAAAYSLDVDDDAYDLSGLSQFAIGGTHCSVVFYPAAFTGNGHSLLSRNYDFTTGTAYGKRPGKGERAMMARPYVFELYPDKGYASLSLCAFDLLGGVLEGINSEGLTVAVLGDDATALGMSGQPAPDIGMHELVSMRYLLDNCGNIEEAKKALLGMEHYFVFAPCHYIIADASGASFVFEFSPSRDSTAIVDGKGIQWVTNHLLSRYPSADAFPDEKRIDTFDRYRALQAALEGKSRFGIDEIESINAAVANSAIIYDHPDYAPGRTLWYSLYDIDERRIRVKFYLGEEPAQKKKKEHIHYSEFLDFHLTQGD